MPTIWRQWQGGRRISDSSEKRRNVKDLLWFFSGLDKTLISLTSFSALNAPKEWVVKGHLPP